eukprot:gene708-387_t
MLTRFFDHHSLITLMFAGNEFKTFVFVRIIDLVLNSFYLCLLEVSIGHRNTYTILPQNLFYKE